ncbi:unnamed protein product, partial [Urochloa humidicola]
WRRVSRHHRHGPTSRWSWPAWSSAACPRTQTASASPPCAVCPQWRHAAREVPLPAPLPLLVLPDGTMCSLPGSEPFRFPGCRGYVDVGGSWLAFSSEDSSFLRNPFTNATVTLPRRFRFQAPSHRAG